MVADAADERPAMAVAMPRFPALAPPGARAAVVMAGSAAASPMRGEMPPWAWGTGSGAAGEGGMLAAAAVLGANDPTRFRPIDSSCANGQGGYGNSYGGAVMASAAAPALAAAAHAPAQAPAPASVLASGPGPGPGSGPAAAAAVAGGYPAAGADAGDDDDSEEGRALAAVQERELIAQLSAMALRGGAYNFKKLPVGARGVLNRLTEVVQRRRPRARRCPPQAMWTRIRKMLWLASALGLPPCSIESRQYHQASRLVFQLQVPHELRQRAWRVMFGDNPAGKKMPSTTFLTAYWPHANGYILVPGEAEDRAMTAAAVAKEAQYAAKAAKAAKAARASRVAKAALAPLPPPGLPPPPLPP